MKPTVSLGDLVVDFVVSIKALPVVAHQYQTIDALHVEPGGAGNFLAMGARLGQPMAAIGALGNDDWGQRAADALRSEQVDLARVRHAGTSTLVLTLADAQGEHVFLGREGRANAMALEDADRALIARASALFISGYTLCEPYLQPLVRDALPHARQHNVPLFFDAGPFVGDAPQSLLRETLHHADTLLLTEDEVALLAPMLDVRTVADLLTLGPHRVVLKRGSRGCEVWTRHENGSQKIVDSPGHAVNVVDTTAAGDCFAAAWIDAILGGATLAEAARWANAVGAAAVQKLGGGRNVPTRAEVEQIYQSLSKGVSS